MNKYLKVVLMIIAFFTFIMSLSLTLATIIVNLYINEPIVKIIVSGICIVSGLCFFAISLLSSIIIIKRQTN